MYGGWQIWWTYEMRWCKTISEKLHKKKMWICLEHENSLLLFDENSLLLFEILITLTHLTRRDCRCSQFFFLNKILLSKIIFCNCKYEMMIQLDVGSELERRIKWSWTVLTFNNWDLISWCDDLIWSVCWRSEVRNCSGDLKNEMGIHEIKNIFSHCESAVTPWHYVLGLSVLKKQ